MPLHIEQLGVKPNINVALSEQKAISGRQAKQANQFRAFFTDMGDMQGDEEVRLGRELLTKPDVPTTRIRRRRVPQSIHWSTPSCRTGEPKH